MKMLDVGAKPPTARVAVARAHLLVSRATRARVTRGEVEKGDVLAAARLAGVMAAKRTPDLIPLCHPIALSAVEVEVRLTGRGVEAVATVQTVDRTGVEMEALTAAATACLTVYDMLKRYERGMRIESIELTEKAGGRTGRWVRKRPGPRPARSPAPRGRSARTRGG
jgi:cyclic pyranopterin phosphate synthase